MIVPAKLMAQHTILENREIIRIKGPETFSFLQGLISNDVNYLTSSQSIYAATLSPQGKYLHDFILLMQNGEVLMDCEKDRSHDLVHRLTLFRLNSSVQIVPLGNTMVTAAIWADKGLPMPGIDHKLGATRSFGNGMIIVDPRLLSLGLRLVAPKEEIKNLLLTIGSQETTYSDYNAHRLSLAVPDGSRDLIVDKSYLLESNFEDLNGVDFDKGCYIGQENTARQKHRGTIRKRLLKVVIKGPPPRPGELIKSDQKEIGTMRSCEGNIGLALIRLDRWEEAKIEGVTLSAGNAQVTPVKPDWVTF